MKREDLFRTESNIKKQNYLKYSIISLVIIILAIIIFAFTSWIINKDKTATIEILVAPTDAKVYIDETLYTTNQKLKILPGTYDIRIEKDNFIPYHESVEIADNETFYLYEYLNEIDENGTFYKDNEKEAGRAQQISDFKADKLHENYNGTDIIWSVTPYQNYKEGIKITADKNEDSSITINIKLQTCSDSRVDELKHNALTYLKNNLVNIENYTLNYSKLC